MQIGLDAKRYFHNHTGLGNYSRSIVSGLQKFFPEEEYKLYDEKSLKRTFGMGRKAEKDGCEVFHGLSNELPLDIKRTKVRSFVTIHDTCWRQFPDMYHAADRLIYDLKYGWAARNADCVIAISESTKRDIQRFYNVPEERISVVYQPVQDFFYEKISKDLARRMIDSTAQHIPEDYLLSVGSVNSRKNLLGSLKALAQISPEERLPLVVIGNGREYMKECCSFAQENLRETDVFWLTSLTDNHCLQAFYTCATALLYPSHYEGFGLPIVEASLQGCPVLTSNTSSLPEAAGPGAILTDPKDTDAIRTGIMTLIGNNDLRKKISAEGEDYCRRMFCPQKQAQKLMSLYKGEEMLQDKECHSAYAYVTGDRQTDTTEDV